VWGGLVETEGLFERGLIQFSKEDGRTFTVVID